MVKLKYEIPKAIDLSGIAVVGQEVYCRCKCGGYHGDPNICNNGCIPNTLCQCGGNVNAGCKCGSVPD